jgi:hypothetical protein
MSRFTTPLELEYIDGRNWKLTAEFDFASDTLERLVCVPVGFVTDFASIPRVLWPFLPPTGPYGKAAVIHDLLYRHPCMFSPCVTRARCDGSLLEGMEALQVNFFVRWIIYLGVRLGGHFAYQGDHT